MDPLFVVCVDEREIGIQGIVEQSKEADTQSYGKAEEDAQEAPAPECVHSADAHGGPSQLRRTLLRLRLGVP